MLPPKKDKILKDLRDLAKNHDIVILSSSKSNTNNSQYLSMADNIISITRNIQSNRIYSFKVTKQKYQCPIKELIDNKDKKGLENYLSNKNNISAIQIKYTNPLLRNCIELVEKESYEYLEIIEKSEVFKNYITDINDFWIKVGFATDNYEFLINRIKIKEIIENKNLQTHIASYLPIKSLNKLLEMESFVEIIEKDFNILNFIKSYRELDDKRDNFLENIVKNIKTKEKYINFDNLFEKFNELNNQNEIENNKYFFNKALKIFIIHSDYVFKDNNSNYISEDNKILIDNKILMVNLNNNLPLKMNVKKPKI